MLLYNYILIQTCLTSMPASVNGHTEPGASVAIGVSFSTSPENDAQSSDRAFSNWALVSLAKSYY